MVMIRRCKYTGVNVDRISCPIDRTPLYVWKVIRGPDCLIGRVLRKVDMSHGGWTDGEIHYRNILTGQVVVRRDSTEEVYDC